MSEYDMLDIIRKRPGMYVGAKKLSLVEILINGYCWGLKDAKQSYSQLYPLPFSLFESYCQIKYQKSNAMGYRCMLLENCDYDEEKALELFFELLDEYRENARIIGCYECSLTKENVNYFQTNEKGMKRLIHIKGEEIEYSLYRNVKKFYRLHLSYGAEILIPESNCPYDTGRCFWEDGNSFTMFTDIDEYMERIYGKLTWDRMECSNDRLLELMNDYYLYERTASDREKLRHNYKDMVLQNCKDNRKE